jgi:hypothetical protein
MRKLPPLARAGATVLALVIVPGLPGQIPAGDTMPMEPAPAREVDFQPHIFWAYGLACALLFLFTLWTLAQARRTRARLDYLEERFRRAYPEGGSPGAR